MGDVAEKEDRARRRDELLEWSTRYVRMVWPMSADQRRGVIKPRTAGTGREGRGRGTTGIDSARWTVSADQDTNECGGGCVQRG